MFDAVLRNNGNKEKLVISKYVQVNFILIYMCE